MSRGRVLLALCLWARALLAQASAPQDAEMAGYLLVPNAKVPASFDAGFSMYVAAWPLLRTYPGNRFQTGLFGTWMFAQFDGPPPKDLYSDIEGGLGWWRDTRFATTTPKFIMGGVAPNFRAWANGPGAGKGRDWSKPAGKYGVAQLSPWVLWPPDGLNLKQGTCGELFGYGYLPLPLIPAKASTGDQCWTLFLNTRNHKGPVAFFTPWFWSEAAQDEPRLRGLLLDRRPSNPNRALQMETQYVPAAVATDAQGGRWARIAPTAFPRNAGSDAMVVHRITSYARPALWDAVQAWFAGGAVASGMVDSKAAVVHTFPGHGGATWRIYPPAAAKEERMPLAWTGLATPTALDPHTFGYRWNPEWIAGAGRDPLATLPEFFRLTTTGKKSEWVPVRPADVPAATGLLTHTLVPPPAARPEPYVTPDQQDSAWKTPGPTVGPFTARLGDGSVVTYAWYRFADQPALQHADLSAAEREALQRRVELLHRHWPRDRDYLPPPTRGTLAELDPAVLVTPPKGLEVGYVPIVTRQAAGQ